MSTTEGLKWGSYVGSPALGAPAVSYTLELQVRVKTLQCSGNDRVYALCPGSTLLTVYRTKPDEPADKLMWSAALCWGFMDGSLRVFLTKSDTGLSVMEHNNPDKVRGVVIMQINKQNPVLSHLHTDDKLSGTFVGSPQLPILMV